MLGATILRIKDDAIIVKNKNGFVVGDKISISENGLTAPDFIIGDKVSFTDRGVTAKGFYSNSGYTAYLSNDNIVIPNDDYSSAVADLRLSYNDLEIFPTYNDELDNILVPKNLLLKSGEEVTNNKYRLNSYTPSEWLVQDEVYTALYDIKLKDNAIRISTRLSNGASVSESFRIDSPIVGVRSVQIVTGIARYLDGRTPEDNPTNGDLVSYIAPNEQDTGGADNTIYKIKVEKGSNPNPVWTPAPEDSVYISNYSSNVTASISDGQLKITNMYGSEGRVEVTYEYYKFTETKIILITKN